MRRKLSASHAQHRAPWPRRQRTSGAVRGRKKNDNRKSRPRREKSHLHCRRLSSRRGPRCLRPRTDSAALLLAAVARGALPVLGKTTPRRSYRGPVSHRRRRRNPGPLTRLSDGTGLLAYRSERVASDDTTFELFEFSDSFELLARMVRRSQAISYWLRGEHEW